MDMKKMIVGTAAILAAVSLSLSCGAISARRAILMDASTGQALYSRDADSRSLVASTTKIMTALVVCLECNVLDRMEIPAQAVGIEGSSMYLREGEELTIQELLYGLMLSSGNDAAVALAIYCGGTVEGFVELMNDQARVLGLSGTHFANPHGLDAPDHYSTARDLAVLAAYAMGHPVFQRIVSTRTVQAGGRHLTNHNKLLWQVPGADGVKTGFTKAAGRILVGSASRDGRRLISVTIDDGDDWRDHKTLLQQGFDDFTPTVVVHEGDVLGYMPVLTGVSDRVELVAREDFTCALRPGEQVRIQLPVTPFVYAPVACGDDAGVAYVYLGDTVLGKVSLTFGSTVEQTPKKHWTQKFFGGGS
jgi:D-alanyl-D-alanine carboxypeptidase